MIGLFCFVLAVLASPFKSKLRLEAENAVLRHQLNVLRRRLHGRVRLTNHDRWQAPFRYVAVDEFPDTLGTLKVYLAGEGENLWAASMICACGCGETIQLNLSKAARPCWEAEPHPDGTVSLSPSIWRRKGCESHFWIRRGQVDWC
jgi:hypothetical protein